MIQQHSLLRRLIALGLLPALALVSVIARAQPAPLGDTIVISTPDSHPGSEPAFAAAAASPAGDLVVAWRSNRAIFARRLERDGTPLDEPFQVTASSHAGTTGTGGPAVAMDADGNFVIAWRALVNDRRLDVRFRRFAADATPLGEVQTASIIPGLLNLITGQELSLIQLLLFEGPLDPDVAMSADGNFVISWRRPQATGLGSVLLRNTTPIAASEILVRPYFVDGTPRRLPKVVALTGGFGNRPSVAMDAGGNFVVAWGREPLVSLRSVDRPAITTTVVRRFDADARPEGLPQQVDGQQRRAQSPFVGVNLPLVGRGTAGDYHVLWNEGSSDEPPQLVRVRRFAADGTPISEPFTITESFQIAAAAAPAGGLAAAWRQGGVVARCFGADGTPIGDTFLVSEDPIGNARGTPAAALNAFGELTVAWHTSTFGGGPSPLVLRRFEGC